MHSKEEIIVSISCITYNHAPYIRQCLDGFLMQKTDFAFEVLIHDDASTDGTEEIIREYEMKYPNIIKPIYEKENQYVLGRRGSKTFNYPRAKGKYIALCEGDDYWTDSYKLQKQVDFLEENPDFCLSNTDSDVLYEDSQYMLKTYNKKKKLINYTGVVEVETILSNRYFIKTATVVFRKDIMMRYLNSKIYNNMKEYLLMGDTPLWAYLSLYGKFHYLNYSTSVYRRRFGTVSNQLSLLGFLRFTLSSYSMRKFYVEYYSERFSDKYKKKIVVEYNKSLINCLIFDTSITYPFPMSQMAKAKYEKIQKNIMLKFFWKQCIIIRLSCFHFCQKLSYFLKKRL